MGKYIWLGYLILQMVWLAKFINTEVNYLFGFWHWVLTCMLYSSFFLAGMAFAKEVKDEWSNKN